MSVGGVGGRRPQVAVTDLKGKEIPQGAGKVVTTASHEISMSSTAGGMTLPDFKVARRTIADPGTRPTLLNVPPAELAAITTRAAFKTRLDALMETHKDYLSPSKDALLQTLPEADRSAYAFLNIVGRRNDQFFDEVQKLIARTPLSGTEATAARRALNEAHRDAFRNRTADFDKANTGTYWSYGHDAAFVHVFEEMLKGLSPEDPRRGSIQAQLDFVFSHKYAPHGNVEENDIEKSLGLTAVDKDSRHVVSMTKASEGSNRVAYETLQVPTSAAGEHAGKFVYRAGEKYFFEKTSTEVPADMVAKLVSKSASAVVFRRAEGETLRSSFRFDWDGNRMLNMNSINTGWWGHCDIKAQIETLLADMKGSGGVTEFRSDSAKTTEFSRDMQLEALAALLNFDDAYLATRGGGSQVRFGKGEFAGSRFDDRPTRMNIKTNRGTTGFDIRLTNLSEKGNAAANVDLDRAFSTKQADEKRESFKDNPDILRVEQGDTNFIDGSGRKLAGQTDGYSFDTMGRPVEHKVSFTLDPTVTTGDKVLLGTELTSIEGRTLNRFYFDPATQELQKVPTRFVMENGGYVAKEDSAQKLGKMTGMELGREMTGGDDVANKMRLLEDAVRTGTKIANDSDAREQVWNGEVHSIRLDTEWRSEDGLWERVGVHVDATFGAGKVGSVLNKLDAEGNVVDRMEIKPAVDFYWREEPRVAPLVSERGNWYVNASMYNRGVLKLGNDLMNSLGAIQDLNDLVYLGLSAREGKKLFTIVHDGKRLVYDDKAAWEADVKQLQGTPEEPGTGGVRNVKVSGTPNLSVPDNDPTGVTTALTVADAGKLKDITVEVDLAHTWVGDLSLSLVAPDGTEVKLHNKTGGSADDLHGTYGLDLTAAETLDALKGKEVKGEWKLHVADTARADTGTLKSWSLGLNVE